VFDNEHSLHLWKRHPCTSTVWRQLTDWREQVTTWRDLRGLLYSHSDTVRVLIQSSCTELQPSNILIWVVWLSDHSVYLLFFPGVSATRGLNTIRYIFNYWLSLDLHSLLKFGIDMCICDVLFKTCIFLYLCRGELPKSYLLRYYYWFLAGRVSTFMHM
jgi:hypothetical protein